MGRPSITVCSLIAASVIFARADHAAAQAEELRVTFDMQSYSQTGNVCFSANTSPTSRTNYVFAAVVWLEDTSGTYVTTLFRWGQTYVYDLEEWALASDMVVDSLTAATPTNNSAAATFTTYNTGWKDISWVPDGTYNIRFETTACETADEYRFSSATHESLFEAFQWTKGRNSQTGLSLGTTAPFANVTVDYFVPASNAAPGAWAGPDQRLMPSLVPAESSTTLNGVVDDDDTTTPPAVQWTLESSIPAGISANIANPQSASTNVTFNASGIFTFRLTATDSDSVVSSDDVIIYVNTRFIPATDDSEVNSSGSWYSNNMGILDNAGPWVYTWGPNTVSACGNTSNGNHSKGYYRFDVSAVAAGIDYARLRLPLGAQSLDVNDYHDFYLVADADEDWNGPDSSTDWEATITFEFQPVLDGDANNLDPAQLVGTYRHVGISANLPPWVEIDLDLSTISAYDANRDWTIFVTNRDVCMSMGFGSRENVMDPHVMIVEHWQSGVNQPPTADPGTYPVIVDTGAQGTEFVDLDGSGSGDDVGIVIYEWSKGGAQLATGVQVSVPLGLGIHDIELKVIDGGDLSDTASVQIIVEDRYYSNRDDTEAALIDGDATGKAYDDLFAYTAAPNGDWYAISLVDGSDLTVDVTMTGGDLDVELLNPNLSSRDSSATTSLTESVGATGLTAGTYYIQIDAPGGATDASTYSMVVTLTGPTLTVALNPVSALETAGTLNGAGTVSVGVPVTADLTVTLISEFPNQLDFVTNPVTITNGTTSTTFDIVLFDDPGGVPDQNRFVNIRATGAGYNQGSQAFLILDNEANLLVVWDKAAESVDEAGSPLIVLTATLSQMPAGTVTVPFTVSGTATNGSDFTLNPTGQISISSATQGTVLISVLDDSDVEGDETLIITMGTPSNATVGTTGEYILTITDSETGTGGAGGAGGTGGDGGPIAAGCSCSSNDDPLSVGALLLFWLHLVVIGWWRKRR